MGRELMNKTDYDEVKALIKQTREGATVFVPALGTAFTELLSILDHLVNENKDLQDKLWAASRQAHANDEWEPEDG